jgi:long-subunit fatty acid transport protein
MRLGKNWLNETLELEISGATQLIRHGYLIRPKLAYKINDHLKVSTGLEYFRGGLDTIFGLQEANKLFFLEMRQFF